MFTLMSLPYDKSALAPHISAETVEFHYGKHHHSYVVKLNNLLAGGEKAKFASDADLTEVVKSSTGTVYNNAAQIWNHNFYWLCLRPAGGNKEPSCPKLKAAIDESFGSFEKFKEVFMTNCVNHFGSGWVWLIKNSSGKLEVIQTHDADLPLKTGSGKALLTCDVWEHAYYIDYRNDRGTYVKNWFEVVNWDFVASNFNEA